MKALRRPRAPPQCSGRRLVDIPTAPHHTPSLGRLQVLLRLPVNLAALKESKVGAVVAKLRAAASPRGARGDASVPALADAI